MEAEKDHHGGECEAHADSEPIQLNRPRARTKAVSVSS